MFVDTLTGCRPQFSLTSVEFYRGPPMPDETHGGNLA
jgi:hypothetical protein